MELDERFWGKVNKHSDENDPALTLGPCWEWMSRKTVTGYGVFELEGKTRRAHILSWMAEHGPVADGLELDHLCRNRACVRPSHLEPVTHKENMRRGKAAQKTHCLRGHLLSGENLRLNTNGGRVCRECHQLRTVESRRHLIRQAKLSPDDVREIRQWGKDHQERTSGDRGKDTITAIAARYGVTRGAIQHVLSRKSWSTVD